MNPLTPQAIRGRLSIRAVGRRIECLDAVDSTNDAAWAAAVAGAEHGTAFFAERQRKGRGRMGRQWESPAGKSLLASVVLRMPLPVERVSLVTVAAALAGADAAQETAGLEPRIRFPNDVVVGARKVAGVLVESRFVSGLPDLFVAGIGMNVNQDRSDFAGELERTATSLKIEKGQEVSRVHAARALLEALDRWVAEIQGPLGKVRRVWRERSDTLGRRVRVQDRGRSYEGVVEDVDPVEGLEVRLQNGVVRLFRGEHLENLRVLPAGDGLTRL